MLCPVTPDRGDARLMMVSCAIGIVREKSTEEWLFPSVSGVFPTYIFPLFITVFSYRILVLPRTYDINI